MARLSLRNVSKRFATVTAVENLSFDVEPGRIFGLLGPNGAGKTTTIRMIAYIMVPDSGSITLNGQTVNPETQQRMGYLPEERGLYRRMRVADHLIYLARLKGLSRADARKSVDYWLDRFDAQSWKKKRVEQLSKGMQQKVQFIATVAHDPDLLIFDEPFSGLDPLNAEVLRSAIFEMRSRGKTILFASHRMEQVEQICDDICLVAEGSSLVSGSLRDVKGAAGRNTVEVAYEGNGSFVDHLRSVESLEILDTDPGLVRLRLRDTRFAAEVLDIARREVAILRFEIMQPSLHEIFVDKVGEHTRRNGSSSARTS